jgi:predicted transglutaminase-like cysteine proteinase
MATYDELNRVMHEVLNNFVYESDMAVWKKDEYWATPKEMYKHRKADGKVHDDCDGFALMCREKLDAMGIENHLIYCKVETGEGHLVCEVDGYIFDCRQSDVQLNQDLPYQWISRSGTKAGQPWHLIIR